MFVCFQAEDGIRDLVRSRGLGDVYKRQGKTYMLGHLLLGYVLAARQSGQPVRILVTAFTHYAINLSLIHI